ncbi:MAG: alpha-N-acetylglucosaminidase C-terminal domain-containing protein [Kiritimatiellae bacterium]|nr:alpha-N-acetylglucosaminidase C-terminal domain-containing protein [Kiritimatiellia bacterium]
MRTWREVCCAVMMTGVGLASFGAAVGQGVVDGCAFPAARGVLSRFAGEAVAERFLFERMSGEEPQAEVSSRDGKILIRATDENRAAAAVGRYIREIAKGHWSRSGNRVPSEWPLPKEALKVKSVLQHFHAYNYCVFSYSFAFYGEQEWRANIDRLALAGFTSALVPTGNMKVWQLFLRDAGFSEAQITAFIPDETAQSWVNCGVMEGVGSPFPPARLDEEASLGKWIVKEMRALGIEPMLQGFTGLLPNSATNVLTGAKWPDAKLYDQGRWAGNLKRPILLDATTETYAKLAKMWYNRLYEVYGISDPHFFVGNLFSEGGVAKGVDCRKIAAAMQHEQQLASPGVTWCISCWGSAPRQDLIDGLNPDFTRIIVLDRNMANGGLFPRGFGKITWIWGELLNFGGNDGMYGGMDALLQLNRHRKGANGATLRGYALESEGLDSNPVFYDLFTDLFFRPEAVTGDGALSRWLAGYSERRYGVKDVRLEEALGILARSIWNVKRLQEGCSETVFCARPKWEVKKSSTWATSAPLYYKPKEIEAAARLYLSVATERPELLELETFRFDFTDVFRQVLSDRGHSLVPRLKTDSVARTEFLSLIRQLDALLACTDAFRLDTYEARARKRAGEHGVRALRRMFTTWIERPNSNLNDYAHHQFAGLLSNYYAKRWEVFFADPDHAAAKLDALETAVPSAVWLPTPRSGNLLTLAAECLKSSEDR